MRVRAMVTWKGQVTIPIAIRRRLGVKDGGPVEYVVDDEGGVRLEVPRFSTVDDIAGIAGKLPRPLEWKEMREIAREDALFEKYRRAGDA